MEIFCQNCHQPNSPEAKFCRFCASPLTPASGGGQQQERRENKGSQRKSAAQESASPRALGALILAICGLVMCCVLTSVPAAILGWMEIKAIEQGEASPAGMTMAQAGLWGGVALTIINLVSYVLLFFFFILSAAAQN